MADEAYARHWRQAVRRPAGIFENTRAMLRNAFLTVSSIINTDSSDRFLRCLYCHYVFDDQKRDFDDLILELQKHGEFVDTDTCFRMIRGEMEIDRKYYHLSFDDGFRNNYENAFPILKKRGVPAIFFVPTSLVGADWNRAKSYCLETTGNQAVIEMMRWNDLRDMLDHGYEIGSHTRHHARFSEISRDQALMTDEILGSKQELESNLDFQCKYISWPYGTTADADEASLDMAREAGYAGCFGAYRGSVVPRSTDIFSVPRHHFEVQWPISHVLYFARGNMELQA